MTLLLPLLLLGTLEAVLRLTTSDQQQTDDPFLRIDSPRSVFSKVNEGGREFYRVTHPEAYRGRKTAFPVIKDNGAIRVFLLGGSASAGWPHPASEIYSAYLKEALQTSFPDQNIEIINVSAHGFASYRVRYIFDDVLDYDPDLFVIYSGNNEFLESRRYADLSFLGWSLQDVRDQLRFLRTFRYFENLLSQGLELRSVLSGKGIMIPDFNLLNSKIEKEVLELRSDGQQYAQVQAHYRFNIEYMVRKAAAAGLPVLLLTVPTNLRDWQPNVSFNQLTGAALEEWRRQFRSARKSLSEKDYERAIESLQKAIEQEPLHAQSYYYLGQSQYGRGDVKGAYENFMKAKELDYNPFRALADFNATLRQIAEGMPNVTLVDLVRVFTESSADGIPGFDLFLDYVHPNKKGNLLIARAVFDAIVALKLLKPTPQVPVFQYRARSHYGPGQPYDESRDVKLQAALLYVYAAMHQYEALIVKAKLIKKHAKPEQDRILRRLAAHHARGKNLNVSAERIKSRYQIYRDQAEKVLEVFPAYLDVQKSALMGHPLAPAKKKKTLESYDRYYAVVKQGHSPTRAR